MVHARLISILFILAFASIWSFSHPVSAQELSLDESTSDGTTHNRETAVRRVGVFISGISPSICATLISELNLKSFLQTSCLSREPNLNELRKKPRSESAPLDAYLLGQVTADEIQVTLYSTLNATGLARWILRANKDPQIWISNFVDTIVRTFPYRGFVLNRVGNQVELNLGTWHGVRRGDRLKLFRFKDDKPGLTGTKETTGDVQLIGVQGNDRSLAEILSGADQINVFDKVSFDSVVRRQMTARTRMSEEGWLAVGFDMMLIQVDTNAPEFDGRSYRHDAAPFLFLSGGRGPFMAYAMSGKGSNKTYEVAYTELAASFEFFEFGSDAKGGFVAVGPWIGSFTLQNSGSASGARKENAQSYGPLFEARYQLVPRAQWKWFSGLEIFYPVFTSGQPSGSLPFSFGGSLSAGGRYDFSGAWGVEFGGRFRYFRTPLSGFSGLEAQYSGFFVHSLYKF